MKSLNFIAFQVLHDPYESCVSNTQEMPLITRVGYGLKFLSHRCEINLTFDLAGVFCAAFYKRSGHV